MKRNISVLGATGSVGMQTLEVIDQIPQLNLHSFSFHSDMESAAGIIKKYRPKYAVCTSKKAYDIFKNEDIFENTKLIHGFGEMVKILGPDIQTLVSASTGTSAIEISLQALEMGITLAIANKESLVSAYDLFSPYLQPDMGMVIPVDSEHSAIYQCLGGLQNERLHSVVLTASGGAFRDKTKEEIAALGAAEALMHPNWKMGRKITIDSATMMNKGLEFIEAKHLFGLDDSQIEVLIHRQSIVHSMARFRDGSVLAQMGLPSMKQPIAYAIAGARENFTAEHVDFTTNNLTFEKPDFNRFPCLKIAMEVAGAGGILPAVMNAANEVLVQAYLDGRTGFYGISSILTEIIDAAENQRLESLEQLEGLIQKTKKRTEELIWKRQ